MALDQFPTSSISSASSSFSSATSCCCNASENPSFIQHVGDPAAHPRRKLRPGPAQHDDLSAGHCIRNHVADGFHPALTLSCDTETFARHAAHEHLAVRRAVERDVR